MGKCINTFKEPSIITSIITRLKEISEKGCSEDFMLIKYLKLYVPIISNNGINASEIYQLLNNIAEEFLKSPNKLI